jgi:hypothetical protein
MRERSVRSEGCIGPGSSCAPDTCNTDLAFGLKRGPGLTPYRLVGIVGGHIISRLRLGIRSSAVCGLSGVGRSGHVAGRDLIPELALWHVAIGMSYLSGSHVVLCLNCRSGGGRGLLNGSLWNGLCHHGVGSSAFRLLAHTLPEGGNGIAAFVQTEAVTAKTGRALLPGAVFVLCLLRIDVHGRAGAGWNAVLDRDEARADL